jgi:site-specific DNA-methyltransferase (adenine-specific)
MLEFNRIYNCDCLEGLKKLDNNSIDLTVTSPPYDNLRTYHEGDDFVWNFDIFKAIADELYRVTKPGCCVVWIVGDACINGGETGSSFKQALYFQEIGFKIHDTMIYEKNSSTFPAKITSKRYSQLFEYMFVFVKGKIRDDIKLIADKKNKWAGWTNWGTHTNYDKNGNLVPTTNNKPTPEYSLRNNIWRYTVSFNDKTGHPAVFPERLAQDHILSWSVEGDLVLDPFMGSGTTAKMAKLNKRNYIGFEKVTKYYDESLVRVSKYDGVENNNLTTVSSADDGEVLQLNIDESDKELEGKKELWVKLIKNLEDYFNEQKLEILKNLTFAFKSKSNDDKVKQIVSERGLTGYTETDIAQDIPSEPTNAQDIPSESANIEQENKLAVEKINKLTEENKTIKEELAFVTRKIDVLTDCFVNAINILKPNNAVVKEENEIIVPEVEPETDKKKRGYTYSPDTKVLIVSGANKGLEGKIVTYITSEEMDDVVYEIEVDNDTHELVKCMKGEFKAIRHRKTKQNVVV